jgi:hypothetical protein
MRFNVSPSDFRVHVRDGYRKVFKNQLNWLAEFYDKANRDGEYWVHYFHFPNYNEAEACYKYFGGNYWKANISMSGGDFTVEVKGYVKDI